MREHTRRNGRYERTHAGALTLDWGSAGGDYKALDFSYVAKGKMGNLFKIYGQVRRGEDGVAYDTYDVKAGNRRLKTSNNTTVSNAIRAHIKAATGEEAYGLDIEMPIAPDTIREELRGTIVEAVRNWDYFWRGKIADWGEERREQARQAFADVWPCEEYFCDPLDSLAEYKVVGILNVDVRKNRDLYRKWREYCEALVGTR